MIRTIDIETSGLVPANDFITAVGLSDDTGMYIFTSPASMFRKDPIEAERLLLGNLVRTEFAYEDILLSYNGISFDVPFLEKRLKHHGMGMPASLLPPNHLDLMAYCKHLNNNVFISKDNAASKFPDLYVPRNSSGMHLALIYRQRVVSDLQHMEMLQHNAIDICATAKMFLLFNEWPEFEAFYKKAFPNFRDWCLTNKQLEGSL